MANRTAAAETALIAIGFAVLFFLLPHGLKGDDWVRLSDLQLLMHGHLTSDKYSLVGPLFSAPFERLDWAIGSLTYFIARFNVIMVAVGTIVAYRLVRGRVEPGLFRKFVLVLLFASMLTNALRGYGAEVTTSTLVVLGVLAVVTGQRPALGWSAIVLGVVNTPGALGGLALITGAEAVRTKRLRLLTPIAAAVLLIGAEAWLRRGSPFHTGYAHDGAGAGLNLPGGSLLAYTGGGGGFSYPFVLGVLAILFSFGRGLMFFAPGLLLWLGKRTRQVVPGRRVVLLMLLYVGGLVLVYAKWWAWDGGTTTWGPRYFVFAAIPASLFIAARVQHAGASAAIDAVTFVVLAVSGWIGVSGAIIDLSTVERNCGQTGGICRYAPEYSSLWQPVRSFPQLTPSTTIFAVYCGLIFCFLATPLIVSMGRWFAPLRTDLSWARGWRL